MLHADQGPTQQQLLSELKRVGTQQEQLKKAVSEAAAEATAQGETVHISPLKSFKLGDQELAKLKSSTPARAVTKAQPTVAEAAALQQVAKDVPAGKRPIDQSCCCDRKNSVCIRPACCPSV